MAVYFDNSSNASKHESAIVKLYKKQFKAYATAVMFHSCCQQTQFDLDETFCQLLDLYRVHETTLRKTDYDRPPRRHLCGNKTQKDVWALYIEDFLDTKDRLTRAIRGRPAWEKPDYKEGMTIDFEYREKSDGACFGRLVLIEELAALPELQHQRDQIILICSKMPDMILKPWHERYIEIGWFTTNARGEKATASVRLPSRSKPIFA